MFRIISSLEPQFNTYMKILYNKKETRTIETMISLLQREEYNLSSNEVMKSLQCRMQRLLQNQVKQTKRS